MNPQNLHKTKTQKLGPGHCVWQGRLELDVVKSFHAGRSRIEEGKWNSYQNRESSGDCVVWFADSPLSPQWYTLHSEKQAENDVKLALWIGGCRRWGGGGDLEHCIAGLLFFQFFIGLLITISIIIFSFYFFMREYKGKRWRIKMRMRVNMRLKGKYDMSGDDERDE